uniref:BAG domain-containing protein n=1 Tax=Nelumbo nucifera TaxID=4432 RepID=A0A822ZEX1_NELNU|nr:TPA_asm: hypothetical protein HUJ06_001667 [Nelumbo nucifera]
MKKIVEIKKEVDEVEQLISRRETVDLVHMDAKERLKVDETLMALLFQLDSVQGIDFRVRECQKKAATMVDCICSNGQILRGDNDVDSSSGTSETFVGDGD